MEVIFVLVLFFVALALYFLPTIVARNKQRMDTGSIFVLNLLLGWTIVGWIIAFVWAAKE